MPSLFYYGKLNQSLALGQDVYFHLNHPIKWVRASGVVIAVDGWDNRDIYTIDDGSGATIQCVVNVAPRMAPGMVTTTTSNQYHPPLPVIDAPIDVGHVLDIKGSVTTFRDAKNIRAEKIAHLRSTEQEVGFWEKVVLLRREVLSKPWVLDRREVRRCRREEEGRAPSGRHRGGDERQKRERGKREEVKKRVDYGGGESGRRAETKTKTLVMRTSRVTGLERRSEIGLENRRETGLRSRGVTGLEKRSETELERKRETGLEKRRVTGLERRVAVKPVTRLIPVTGKYDALGL